VQLGAVVARGLFGREREQVDFLPGLARLHRVEPAGEQDLVDQGVELGDVLLELKLAPGLGAVLHQLERHADAGERRAQLVRGVGEQRLVRGEQLLDARRRAVEALGQARHLVAALDLDPRRQVAAAERLDARLQVLQPPREPPHHGIGAHADAEREHGQGEEQSPGRMAPGARHARHQPAAVGQLQAPGRRARVPPQPATFAALRARRRQRTADPGLRRIVGAEQRHVGMQPGRQALERGLLRGERRLGRRQRVLRQHRGHLGGRPHDAGVGELAPQEARGEREHREARDHRQVDAQIEPAHQSCALANT
jgi:hypothetical protein